VAQSPVEAKGITSKVRVEEVISGHLAALNGKFSVVTQHPRVSGHQGGSHTRR